MIKSPINDKMEWKNETASCICTARLHGISAGFAPQVARRSGRIRLEAVGTRLPFGFFTGRDYDRYSAKETGYFSEFSSEIFAEGIVVCILRFVFFLVARLRGDGIFRIE